MEKHWSVVVFVVAACGLCAAQDDKPKLPPLITAAQVDQVWFMVDNEDYSFTLDCEAEGSGPISYKWEKVSYDDDGVRTVVKDYSVNADDATVSISKLYVDTPQAYHQGAYQCTATNQYGATVSNIIQVKRIVMKRPRKSSDVTQNEASSGNFFRMSCDDTTSYPPASFSWSMKSADKKERTRLESSDRVVVAGDGALIFTNVQSDDASDGRFYQCYQRNAKTDVEAGGKLNSLIVVPGPDDHRHAPSLVYSTELKDDTIVLGEHVRVQCVFSGNPTPRVSWSFRASGGSDDEEIPEILSHPGNQDNLDMTTLTHTLGKELGADEMTPPPEGTLTCRGSSSEGDAEHSIPIKIQYPPRLAASPSVRKVAAGEEVIFSCGADGNPKPQVEFLINGEVAQSTDRRVIEEMTMDWNPYRAENSVLKVMTIQETCLDTDDNTCEGGQDIFSIQCLARNKHGSAVGSGFLALYDPEAEGAEEMMNKVVDPAGGDEDENTCTDPEVLTSVDGCKDTYQDDVDTEGLCMAYCNYHVCIKDLKLDCTPPSIGNRDFCNGLCIEEGLMVDPSPPKSNKEKTYKGLNKKVITGICLFILILILLLILFALYKIYKKRQQKRKYKGVSTVYKPTTEA